MLDNPLATAKIAWLIRAFAPGQPVALRRWVRAYATPVVPDLDVLNALVLVVNEAVTVSGEGGDQGDPVTVELWRRPDELRFHVTCATVLPTVSRTELPDDPRMRALWLALQVESEVFVDIVTGDRNSHIFVTLRASRWS